MMKSPVMDRRSKRMILSRIACSPFMLLWKNSAALSEKSAYKEEKKNQEEK